LVRAPPTVLAASVMALQKWIRAATASLTTSAIVILFIPADSGTAAIVDP
jgi:hypothetical protein